MRLFGWSGKFYFPEIEIHWPKKKAFDQGNAFTLLFSLQSIFGKWERERERARARAREEKIQSEIASSSSSPRSRSTARSRSEIAIAPLIAISDCDHGAVVRLETFLELMISGLWLVFSGLWLVFSDLCFPSSFPNTRKYFPENFLKCNQTPENIFLFRKLAFPENMYFSENVLQQPNTA